MKILILCLLLHDPKIVRTLAFEQWRGEQHQSPDTDTLINQYDESPQEPRWWNDRLFYESMEPRKRVDITSACSCESQYEINDLGEGHYPRYLTVSRCKPRTCQSKFHSCRLLHYTVHVLTEREPKGPQSNYGPLQETPLPESLRHKWQLKPVSVAVACVPISAGRRT